MLLARRFDERLLSLQRQGRIGTFPPISGQEAAHLGAAAVLRPSDWVVPAFREMAADIWRGRSLESIIVYNNGFSEGGRVPADRNDMPISDAGRLPDPARRRDRLGDEVPRERRRGHDLLRRRGDLPGRFPRGPQLRRRIPGAGRLCLPEQPVGHIDSALQADPLQNPGPESARLRNSGDTGGRQRHPGRLCCRPGGDRACPRRGRGRP